MFYTKGGEALAKVAQRLCGLILRDLKNSPGRGPTSPALGGPTGEEVGPDGPRGPCQPQSFEDSVILRINSLTGMLTKLILL